MVSSQHTWDYCNGFIANKKVQSWQTKRVMHFRSNGERKQGDPLSSLLFNTVLQYSLENDLKRWQEKQKRNQTERQNRGLPEELEICRRCTTLLHVAGKIAWNVMWIQGQHKSSGSGNPARQDENTQQQRTKWKQKRSRLTTSRSKFWQKETVRDILERKSRSRSRKQKRSKTD